MTREQQGNIAKKLSLLLFAMNIHDKYFTRHHTWPWDVEQVQAFIDQLEHGSLNKVQEDWMLACNDIWQQIHS